MPSKEHTQWIHDLRDAACEIVHRHREAIRDAVLNWQVERAALPRDGDGYLPPLPTCQIDPCNDGIDGDDLCLSAGDAFAVVAAIHDGLGVCSAKIDPFTDTDLVAGGPYWSMVGFFKRGAKIERDANSIFGYWADLADSAMWMVCKHLGDADAYKTWRTAFDGPQGQPMSEPPPPTEAGDDHLKPAHRRAKAAYEWAIENIQGAENMTVAQLHAALMDDGRWGGDGLPAAPATFSRYLRNAGVNRNTPRKGRAGRSITHRNKL